MQQHRYKETLPYNAKKLYEIIKDVENYPNFLPWISKAEILNSNNIDMMEVMLRIDFGVSRYNYISNVNYQEYKDYYYIRSISSKGILQFLCAEWRIKSIRENISQLEFKIEFEFVSNYINKILNTMLDKVSSSVLSAFKKEAESSLN